MTWKKEIISQHLLYIQGVELVFFEFKEILVELALKLQDKIDSAQNKLKSLIKKFLEDVFFKRLLPYIKFKADGTIQSDPTGKTNDTLRERMWPESDKDQIIKVAMEERKKLEEEIRKQK